MTHSNRFRILDDAMRLNSLVRPVVDCVAKHDRKLADQLRRAVQSVAGNIAEGTNRRGGHQRERFDTAYGSARETKAWLELAGTWGYVDESRVASAWDLADKVCASLWRCTRA